MVKILKKYTTIPQFLYVNRSADEQLKNIVNEMQRPGYVLVARQMGKTNLLFNAKRTLENKNRLFVYVDLSNTFKYEIDCYRNIIDNIIEPNENLFESIESEIYSLRDKNLPSHKEYSKSLRLILNEFKGDIVIILDEIDALRSADYSDNIFAQIRSNYFSRTNFPEFERLTYILSGVIDPIELIKDRNKSPFNIGDKIYLDDFTKDEHNSFIEKSELNITNEISDAIYAWTNGNPRLTFDICSQVESILIENNNITNENLNKLIKNNYLTTFDIAPIDHIRELVKSSKDVRNAVLNIHRSKKHYLSDEIKKKLYLYGIINSRFDKDTFIKNRIIKLSLSEGWIKSIDKQFINNLSYGLEKIEQFEYEDAITALTGFIENSDPKESKLEICNYNLGYAYYQIGKIDKAIEYFSKDYNADLYKRNSKSLLGICKIGIGLYEEGIEILEKIIETKSNDFAYRNALLNLAPLLRDDNKNRSIELYDELFRSTFEPGDDTKHDELNKLRTLAQYYKTEIYFQDKEPNKALESTEVALKYASPSDSLYLKYFKFNLLEGAGEQLNSEIIDTIINYNLKFDTGSSYPISFSEAHLALYLELVFDSSNIKLFKDLLNYIETELYSDKSESFKLVYVSSINSDKSRDILNYMLGFEESIPQELLLKIYRDLSFKYFNNPSEYLIKFKKYKIIFEKSKEILSDDIYLFSLAIKYNSNLNRIKNALELCDFIDSRINNLGNKGLEFDSIIIYYWYAALNFSIKNKIKSIQYAKKAMNIIIDLKIKHTSMIDEEGLKSIMEQLKQIIDSSIIKPKKNQEKKYGRNEIIKVKYLNGKIVENKFKKLEVDILNERCTII